MYHEIRRKDRVLDEKGAIELLETQLNMVSCRWWGRMASGMESRFLL